MKNKRTVQKTWKACLMGIIACVLLGGCSNVGALTDKQAAMNEVSVLNKENAVSSAGVVSEVDQVDIENTEKVSETDSSATYTRETEKADTDTKAESTRVSTKSPATAQSPMIYIEIQSDPVYRENVRTEPMLMYIQYPVIEDYSKNSGTTLNRIYESVNQKCKEEADRYRADYESLARDEYNHKTDWEDDAYFYSSTGYLRRMDESVFSMVEYISSYAHGAHPSFYYNTHNYNAKTGKEITLDDLVSDKEALYNALKKALAEKMGASILYDELVLTALHDSLYDASYDGANFSIEKDGVSFWFGSYDLNGFAEGNQMVTIPFKSNEGLFNNEYASDEEDFVKMLLPDVTYELSSGHTLRLSMEYQRPQFPEDYERDTHIESEIVYNKSIKVFSYVDALKIYLVHKNGNDYLYCHPRCSNDDELFIYSLNGDRLEELVSKEMVYPEYDMTDTKNILMYTRIDALSSMWPAKRFYIGEDGMPVSDEPYYYLYDHALTLIQNLKVEVATNEETDKYSEEVLPAGTVMRFFRTNAKDFMDMKLQDGRIVRLRFDIRNYEFRFNGINENELFEGMNYCD